MMMMMMMNITYLWSSVYCSTKPVTPAQYCYNTNNHKPKPDKDENFLIKEIDGKNTLYCMSVNTAQLSHLQRHTTY